MAFSPRTTAPSRSDPLWRTVSSGGRNLCINIVGGSVLPNCFSGDTEVITDRGIVRIDSLCEQVVNVPTLSGWLPAKFKSFGIQELWEVKFDRNTYRCTSDHRWPIFTKDRNFIRFAYTHELDSSMYIIHTMTQEISSVKSVRNLHIFEPVYCASQPDTTTITLGGGELTGQCVGYAWGRFMEILGDTPSLCRGNAGTWFGYSDKYKHVSDYRYPQLGAVICWSNPGAAGHVAIVEKINNDGSILVSQSGYQTRSTVYDPTNRRHFNTETLRPPHFYPYNSSKYKFQGFIYNPNCEGMADSLSTFINEAKSHIGENSDWTRSETGISSNQSWSTAFVCAVAKQVNGVLGAIIPNTTSPTYLPSVGVSLGMGTWYTNTSTPEPGDIICILRNSQIYLSLSYSNYICDFVGIVSEVTSNTVTGIFGDSNGRVEQKSYSRSNTSIRGFYRPNWSQVGASVSNMLFGPLYTTTNVPRDADLREIGYMNSNGQPSINTTKIKLSAVNYTSLVASVYDFNIGRINSAISSSMTYQSSNLSALDSVPREIIQYLESKGLNTAAGVGVVANMQHESGFRTNAVGDNSTSFGICQWHAGRGERMKQMAGPNWQTNLTGQLDYLWYELTTSYTSVLRSLQSVSNNLSGARSAADIFVRRFEVPANVDRQSRIRQDTASEYWSKLSIQSI